MFINYHNPSITLKILFSICKYCTVSKKSLFLGKRSKPDCYIIISKLYCKLHCLWFSWLSHCEVSQNRLHYSQNGERKMGRQRQHTNVRFENMDNANCVADWMQIDAIWLQLLVKYDWYRGQRTEEEKWEQWQDSCGRCSKCDKVKQPTLASPASSPLLFWSSACLLSWK